MRFKLEQLKISHIGTILVSVPLVLSTIFICVLAFMLYESEQEAQREAHANSVILTVESIAAHSMEATSSIPVYVMTRSNSFRTQFDNAKKQARNEFVVLDELIKNDERQSKKAEKWRDVEIRGFQLMEAIEKSLGDDIHDVGLLEIRGIARQLQSLMHQELANRQAFVAELKQEQSKSHFKTAIIKDLTTKILISAFVLNMVLSVVLVAFFSRSITKRLFTLVDNSSRLASGQELQPTLEGKDEIALLDREFHAMAAALDQSRKKEKETVSLLTDSEARMRLIVASMPIGLLILGDIGTIEITNLAATEMFGYQETEMEGLRFKSMFPPDAKTEAMELEQYLQHLEKSARMKELFIRKKDGNRFPCELASNEFFDRGQRKFLVMVTDVTEVHEMQRLKQEFLAIISHELRTPLTSIQVFMESLLKNNYGPLTDKGANRAVAMTDSVQRLIRLINDLLDSEKMAAGKLTIESMPMQLYPAVLNAADGVTEFAQNRRITLECAPFQCVVNGDSDRIVQLLINLMSNAIKYSPEGGMVKLSVTLEEAHVLVEVSDQGPGVPEGYEEIIFERFQHVDSQDAQKRGGTGLGLALCKYIVEKHGGTIGVRSIVGQGSVFWFRLPRQYRNLLL